MERAKDIKPASIQRVSRRKGFANRFRELGLVRHLPVVAEHLCLAQRTPLFHPARLVDIPKRNPSRGAGDPRSICPNSFHTRRAAWRQV